MAVAVLLFRDVAVKYDDAHKATEPEPTVKEHGQKEDTENHFERFEDHTHFETQEREQAPASSIKNIDAVVYTLTFTHFTVTLQSNSSEEEK